MSELTSIEVVFTLNQRSWGKGHTVEGFHPRIHAFAQKKKRLHFLPVFCDESTGSTNVLMTTAQGHSFLSFDFYRCYSGFRSFHWDVDVSICQDTENKTI